MRTVIQRVKSANVKIENKIVGKINQGLLVLLAVHEKDPSINSGQVAEDLIQKMAEKIINLRIFSDFQDKMNLSVRDIADPPASPELAGRAGEILVVSQFTLYGDCSKGNRPSFIKSAKPEKAISYYEKFVKYIREQGIEVKTGEFGAMMQVELINDGPVTIIIDL